MKRFALVLRPLAAAAVLGATVAAAPPAVAAPDGTADPLGGLLAERGLIPTVASDATRLVREVSSRASELVITALNFLGVPYKRGGNSAELGFDCSGFTRHIFQNTVGLLLPHRAEQQAADPQLRPIDRTELEPGDLVFFNTMRRAFSHVGIYIGDGKFVHSPRAGGQVRVEDMQQAYWARRFDGARRALLAETDRP